MEKNELAVDPTSMAYGESRNAKKTCVGLFILESFTKNKKMAKQLHFFTVFSLLKIVDISGLVIGRANPRSPVESFVQAGRFAPKFSSLKGR